MSEHVRHNDFLAYAQGRLGHSAQRALQSHLEVCPDCRAALERTLEVLERGRGGEGEREGPGTGDRDPSLRSGGTGEDGSRITDHGSPVTTHQSPLTTHLARQAVRAYEQAPPPEVVTAAETEGKIKVGELLEYAARAGTGPDCPSTGLLERFAAGGLTQRAAQPVLQHLSRCSDCRRYCRALGWSGDLPSPPTGAGSQQVPTAGAGSRRDPTQELRMTQSPVHRLFNLWHLLGVAAAVFALIGANKPELWQDGGLLDVGLSRFPTTLQIPAVAPNGTEGEGREGKGAEGAEEQGSKGAREQGSKGAREQGSKGARETRESGTLGPSVPSVPSEAVEQSDEGSQPQAAPTDAADARAPETEAPASGPAKDTSAPVRPGTRSGASVPASPCPVSRVSRPVSRVSRPVSRVPRVHVPKPPAPPSPRPSRERSQEQRRKNAPTLQRADTPTLHPDIARFLAAPPRMTGPHAPTSTSRAGRDGGDEG